METTLGEVAPDEELVFGSQAADWALAVALMGSYLSVLGYKAIAR
jgi:hypothetical protein